MRAPSAGFLLKQIAARRMQADATRVADLNDAERAAVVRALERVSPRARIDVRLLVDTVTTAHRARVEAEAARRAQTSSVAAFAYRVSVAPMPQLEQLRDQLRSAQSAGETAVDFGNGSVAAAIMSEVKVDRRPATISAPAAGLDAALDEIDGINDSAPRPRRSTPRVPSKRSRMEQSDGVSAPATRPASKYRPNTPATRAPAPFFHGRAFGPHGDSDRPLGCPVGVRDYDNWKNPKLPAWIIGDGDSEPDKETEDACESEIEVAPRRGRRAREDAGASQRS